MSWGGKQPIGQKRLTNIALVRYKKMGHRFEIACYKNKVLNWRHGIEKDLDEVLQTVAVFTHVSKGILAKDTALQEVFATTDHEEVCRTILAEGEVQVSDKEREVELGQLFRDVACTLAEKCINPDTQRPYTITLVERALKDAHFSVDPHRSAKQQALHALPLLQQRLRIERARMRLKLTLPVSCREEVQALLDGRGASVETQDLSLGGDQLVLVCLVEPGSFRDLHSLVQRASDGRGQTEVLALAAMGEGLPQAGMPPVEPPHGACAAAPSGADHLVATPASQSHRDVPLGGGQGRAAGTPPATTVVVSRCPIGDLPESQAGRRERLLELDRLQAGWTVELRQRGGAQTLDAVLFSPRGSEVGAFAVARRQALQAFKADATS